MKRLVKTLRRIILFTFLTLFMLLSIVNAPWFFVSSKTSTIDYSSWMKDNLQVDQKIIDIAMLGAHDAFSHEIGIFSSVDINSADGIMQGFIGNIIKGFSVRQSKTQVVSAKELLKSGVRYFDIRLSFNEDKETYYTVHNYFSSPLTEVLFEIEEFLIENPGEFLILDIQHVYGVDYDNLHDFNEVYGYFQEANIFDYAYLNNIKELKEISYSDITDNGSKAGVIILSKFQHNKTEIWDYSSNIRSAWANSDNYSEIVSFLETEREFLINNQVYFDGFRVMQAVATMQMSVSGIFGSFQTWSLLGRAREFNQYLLNYENFDLLVEAMPIIMIDYSSDTKIVDQMMERIITFNS